MNALLAIVPVDGGELVTGGDEAIAEAGGRCVLIGDDVAVALESLDGLATEVHCLEAGAFEPARWAGALVSSGVLGDATLILPGSPNGRDLAPRLAFLLDRPLISGAVSVDARRAVAIGGGGQTERDVMVDRPAVAVLVVGVRSADRDRDSGAVVTTVGWPADSSVVRSSAAADAVVTEVLPADPATIDLAEASRVVAGGAGIGSAERLELLGSVGLAIGASLGATRVLTDAGWIPHTRQIGTTGVEIDPSLYVAVGISGAVQHLMGIGNPEHVISVNTDPSCPMMNRADLAIVTDAPAFVSELARRLGVGPIGGER